MSKIILTSLIIFLTSNLRAQSIPVDTLNSHCTVCSVGNFAWGHHDGYYKAKKCPRRKRNEYFKEHAVWESYVATNRVYWMKVYDINEKLIFEGLFYSDCTVGAFKSYYLNGNVRLEGSYNGYLIDPVKGYIFQNCDFNKKGEWNEYNKEGSLIKREYYP